VAPRGVWLGLILVGYFCFAVAGTARASVNHIPVGQVQVWPVVKVNKSVSLAYSSKICCASIAKAFSSSVCIRNPPDEHWLVEIGHFYSVQWHSNCVCISGFQARVWNYVRPVEIWRAGDLIGPEPCKANTTAKNYALSCSGIYDDELRFAHFTSWVSFVFWPRAAHKSDFKFGPVLRKVFEPVDFLLFFEDVSLQPSERQLFLPYCLAAFRGNSSGFVRADKCPQLKNGTYCEKGREKGEEKRVIRNPLIAGFGILQALLLGALIGLGVCWAIVVSNR